MLVYVQGRIIKNHSLCTGEDNKMMVYVQEEIIKL